MKNKFIIFFFGFVFLIGCSEEPTSLSLQPLRSPIVGDEYYFTRYYLDSNLLPSYLQDVKFTVVDSMVSFWGYNDLYGFRDRGLIQYYGFDSSKDFWYVGDQNDSSLHLVRFPIYSKTTFIYNPIDSTDLRGMRTTFTGTIKYDGEEQILAGGKYVYAIKTTDEQITTTTNNPFSQDVKQTITTLRWFVPEYSYFGRIYQTRLLEYPTGRKWLYGIEDSLKSCSLK